MPPFPHLFAMKWWTWMPWSSFSECWALSQLFHSPLSLSSRGSLVLLCFLSVVSSAYLRLLIFLLDREMTDTSKTYYLRSTSLLLRLSFFSNCSCHAYMKSIILARFVLLTSSSTWFLFFYPSPNTHTRTRTRTHMICPRPSLSLVVSFKSLPQFSLIVSFPWQLLFGLFPTYNVLNPILRFFTEPTNCPYPFHFMPWPHFFHPLKPYFKPLLDTSILEVKRILNHSVKSPAQQAKSRA